MEADLMEADLAVVGAGPAGLAAAAAVAGRGARVVVVDEGPAPGGRLPGQVHGRPGRWRVGERQAAVLTEAALAAGARILSGRAVWALTPGWQVHLEGSDPACVRSPLLLLATGSSQQALAVPGWTLPGVLAVGAVQSLVNVHRVAPGRRALVVGVDPLALSAAQQLGWAGVSVVGVALPPPGPLGGDRGRPAAAVAALGRLAGAAGDRVLAAAGALAGRPWAGALAARCWPDRGLRIQGLRLRLRRCVLELRGTDRVQAAVLGRLDPDGRLRPGGEETVAVDTVCLAGGLQPLAELAAAAGCQMAHIPALGGTVPLHGPELQTTCPGLYVAGSITGIEGAGVAEAQGRLAGAAVARRLGLPGAGAAEVAAAAAAVEAARRGAPLQFHPDLAGGRRALAALWAGTGGHLQAVANPGM